MIVPESSIKPDNQEGFTLLEILVSLAVMAIVLVSVFRLHASTLKLADATRSKSLVPFIVRQQLAEILSRPSDETTTTGEIEIDGTLYQWSCTAEENRFEDPISVSPDQAKRFKALTLTLSKAGDLRTFSLTTWRYQGETPE